MASPQKFANSFVIDFFECFARDPSSLGTFYGSNATITFSDFEMGVNEKMGSEIPDAIAQFAACLQDSQLRVDGVWSAPLNAGFNVFVTFYAVNDKEQQYFHLNTTLESAFTNDSNVSAFYIQHQVMARIGVGYAQGREEYVYDSAQVAETPEPVEQPQAPVEPAAVEEPAPAVQPTPEPTPEPEQVAEEPTPERVPTPTPAPAAPAQEAPRHQEEQVVPDTKPRAISSWAALASSNPKPATSLQPVRVVAPGGEEASASTAAAATAAPTTAAVAAPKEIRKREKKPSLAIGDRTMFIIDEPVSDEDIKKAIGSLASSIVSLRNLSASKGNVFIDFAEGVNAFEELKKSPPVLGETNTKVNVQRQRERPAKQ